MAPDETDYGGKPCTEKIVLRRIPDEISQLSEAVLGLEEAAVSLGDQIASGSMPETNEPCPADDCPENACPTAESIAELRRRVFKVRDHIHDMCERVQL